LVFYFQPPILSPELFKIAANSGWQASFVRFVLSVFRVFVVLFTSSSYYIIAPGQLH